MQLSTSTPKVLTLLATTLALGSASSAVHAAMLAGLGFEHVFNLKGGMLDWQ